MGTNIGRRIVSTWIIGSPHQKNVFSEKLGIFGFDLYTMLVVDLMHEFELGVWKAVFSHLIRILYAAGPSGCLVSELDKRYVFPFVPIEKNVKQETPDSARFQLLVLIQSGNFPIMPLK